MGPETEGQEHDLLVDGTLPQSHMRLGGAWDDTGHEDGEVETHGDRDSRPVADDPAADADDIPQERSHSHSREPWELSDSEKKEFEEIDRDKEDLMVKRYRKTEDPHALHDLYLLREPTLKVWARRAAYLADSEDDMFADLRVVWLRCVNRYKYEAEIRPVRTKQGGFVRDEDGKIKKALRRTAFNTFLYTSLRNHISNIHKKRHSLKRLDNEGVPIQQTMKSLDYQFGDEDGQTLKDTIAAAGGTESYMDIQTIISQISRDDEEIREALETFAFDKHLQRLSTACRLCTGTIPVSMRQRKVLEHGGDEAVDLLNKLILFLGRFGNHFKVVSYQVYSRKVTYEVYGHDTRLFRKVMRAIGKWREQHCG